MRSEFFAKCECLHTLFLQWWFVFYWQDGEDEDDDDEEDDNVYEPSDVEDEGDSSSEDSEESNWSDEDESGKKPFTILAIYFISIITEVALLNCFANYRYYQ